MATLFRRVRSQKSCYYSRFLVPTDLRPLLHRKEIQKGLRTSCYTEARLLAAQWEGRVASLLLYLRRNRERMTPDQINQLVRGYIASELEAGEEERLTRTVDDEEREAISCTLTDLLEGTEAALIGNDFSKIGETADELLQAHQRTLPKDSIEYRRLCRELLKARQVVLKAELDRIDGNYWGPGSSAYSVQPNLPSGERASLPLRPSKSIQAVVDAYFEENPRSPRTDFQKRSGLARFIEVIGGDRPIQEITKQDCIRYKTTLLRLPKHWAVRHKGSSIAQVLADADAQKDYETCSASTVNRLLRDLSSVFTWAIGHDEYAGGNPVDGLFVKGGKTKKRKPFTDEEIRRMFVEGELSRQVKKHPERFFIPLLLLYSGARLGEIAQLGIADVKQEEGAWYLAISEDEEAGKTVKTEASNRRVPIHSHLIELGLLRYVQKIQAGGVTQLFPNLKRGQHRGHGDAVSKWWGRHLDKVGITDHSKVIHSFRHTVRTRLEGVVPRNIIDALVGHEDSGVAGLYTHREFIPIKLLQEHLEKLDFRAPLAGLPKYQ